MKLLRDNNIDDYIDLLSKEKNSRIMTILEQTHSYLQKLGAKVSIQKSQNALIANKKEVLDDLGEQGQVLKDADDIPNVKEGEELDALG